VEGWERLREGAYDGDGASGISLRREKRRSKKLQKTEERAGGGERGDGNRDSLDAGRGSRHCGGVVWSVEPVFRSRFFSERGPLILPCSSA